MATQRSFPARRRLLIVLAVVVAASLAATLLVKVVSAHGARRAVQPSGGKSVAGRGTAQTAQPVRAALARNAGCNVSYTANAWPGQFDAKITIRNTGVRSIRAWKLTFTFPGDERISSGWNTTFTQVDAGVSATHTNYYDADIPPGASQALGFLGTWQSSNAVPTSFRVNGVVCR
jgi:hypothetical protein